MDDSLCKTTDLCFCEEMGGGKGGVEGVSGHACVCFVCVCVCVCVDACVMRHVCV